MEYVKYCFKPNKIVPISIMSVFIIISLIFLFKAEWFVALLFALLALVILPSIIRSFSEKILLSDDCITLQNVDCVKENETGRIDSVAIKWDDIKKIEFDTSLRSSFLVIKSKYNRTYIKNLEDYFPSSVKKMKTIIHQYIKNKKKH